MNIDDHLKLVKKAEVECDMHAENARNAWKSLKGKFRDAATPWRIVTVGTISGFLMGRSGGARGDSVGAKLFGTVAQALITTLGAGATAGAAATSAADAAAAATVDAVDAVACQPATTDT